MLNMETEAIEMDEFLEFLNRKNIDPDSFKAEEPEIFSKWLLLFGQVHEQSFTMQQKFLINPLRRRFPKVKFKTQITQA